VRDEIVDILLGKQEAPTGILLPWAKNAVEAGMCVQNLPLLIFSYSDERRGALQSLVQYRNHLDKRPARATKKPRVDEIPVLMTGPGVPSVEDEVPPNVWLKDAKVLLQRYEQASTISLV